MKTILYLNHSEQRCGVYQLGAAAGKALQSSQVFRFIYSEVNSAADAHAAVLDHLPDAILYNWHPSTMAWLCDEVVTRFARPVGVACHDTPYPRIAHAHMHLDPTFPECWEHFRIRRLVPEFRPPETDKTSTVPVIGSFGFGFCNKGFSRLVEQVNQEFDKAVIRLHIPAASFGDADGGHARAIVTHCRALCKAGIEIQASHEFLEADELLDWLAGNSINCFFYDVMYGRGISSAADLALAVRRPIAISQSWMFRHMMRAADQISIEASTIRAIMARGDEPLRAFREEWREANVVADYERVAAFLTRLL